MSTLTLDYHAVTKVAAKACTWADRLKDVEVAPSRQQRKARGRLEASEKELAEAVEKLRKVSPP